MSFAVLCRVTREGLVGVEGCMVVCVMIGDVILLLELEVVCDALSFFLDCSLDERFFRCVCARRTLSLEKNTV